MNRQTVLGIELGEGTARAPRYRAYPTYRDSGVDWLGRMPSHWECAALRRVTISKCDGPFGSGLKSEHYSDGGVRVVRLQNVRSGQFLDEDQGFISHDYYRTLGDHDVRQGDLLLAGLGDEQHPVGRACVAPAGICPAMVKADCFRFRLITARAHAQYLAHFLSASAHLAPGRDCTGTTRQRMNLSNMASRVVFLPPLPEQRAIAAFLDRETGRIDTLIAKKERLIKLLGEKRTALISHAVTKGLNPSAPMKDSRVAWLGEVPAHWQVKRLKFAVTFQRGHDLPASERMEGAVPVVTSAGPSGWHNQRAARGPGIVTGRYGTIGTFHLIEGDYWPLNTTLYSIDLHNNVPAFLWHMLHVLTDVFLVNAGKSAVPGVDRNDLHPLLVAVPPEHEQSAIVQFLDDELHKFEELASRVQTAVERLREYRSALISAAVTGKIDVRELNPGGAAC